MIITDIQLPGFNQDTMASKGLKVEEGFSEALLEILSSFLEENDNVNFEELDEEQHMELLTCMNLHQIFPQALKNPEISVDNSDSGNSIVVEQQMHHGENIVTDYIINHINDNIIDDSNDTPNEGVKPFLEVKPDFDVKTSEFTREPIIAFKEDDTGLHKLEFLNDLDKTPIVEEKEVSPEIIETTDIKPTFDFQNKDIMPASDITPKEEVAFRENIQNISNSIVRMVATSTEGEATVMKVQLYPEDLGTINVVMKMEEGNLTVKLLVDNEQVKQMFSDKISVLSENIIKHDIQIHKMDVELNPNLSFSLATDFNESLNSHNNNQRFKRNQMFRYQAEAIQKDGLRRKDSYASGISILA